MPVQKEAMFNHLHSLRRRDTEHTVIAEKLRGLDLSKKEFTLTYRGDVRKFSRHENGLRWKEEGVHIKSEVYVARDAVVLRNSIIYEDVVAIYGSKYGNILGYLHYE